MADKHRKAAPDDALQQQVKHALNEYKKAQKQTPDSVARKSRKMLKEVEQSGRKG